MKPFATMLLRRTGFLTESDEAVEGLVLRGAERVSVADAARLGPLLEEGSGVNADAVFRVGTSPIIIFKSSDEPSEAAEEEWHRLAWNCGAAPILWVTTPQYVRLYNAFAPPADYATAPPTLVEFSLAAGIEATIEDIVRVCGRQHMAMGSFWRSPLARSIDRQQRVDSILLDELGALLDKLVLGGLSAALAQKLVGRCIFFQYLVHRGYVPEAQLQARFGGASLSEILNDQDRAYRLFRWLRTTFNGDLFPIEDESSERAQLGPDSNRLAPLADFFGHFSVRDGQGKLFPFRFEAIPVELISSIYEKFVHLSDTDGSPREGVHYTPINLVDLVLDPVFEGLPADARVLDPACGSGVFLVESLRRLVWLRSQGSRPSRQLIRETLLRQVRGIDISPAALSVAAFSLYLALLELDPDPPSGIADLESLRFEPLNETVLFSGSTFDANMEARQVASDPESLGKFDVIVGNPPWTYRAIERADDRALSRAASRDEDDTLEVREDAGHPRSGTTYARLTGRPLPPRSPDWAFLWRAADFAKPTTRMALLMKATPFFSLDQAPLRARAAVLKNFDNVTLVNLSQLRTARLFQEYEEDGSGRKPTAGPALIFMSNCLATPSGEIAVINFPWSSTFARTGLFELPAEAPSTLRLERLEQHPFLLKATMLGSERDAWFLERLTRNSNMRPLKEWLRGLDMAFGQGFQPGTTMPASHLFGLPIVGARSLARGRIVGDLPLFKEKLAHRARDPAIFKGPLVLLPEGALTGGPAAGRYTAAYDERDLAFTESFVGVSFAGRGVALAKAFAAVMHSALFVEQLAMRAGTLGVKQTKVEAVDLYGLLVPRLDTWPARRLARLAGAYDKLVDPNAGPIQCAEALATIDGLIAEAIDLSDADLNLLKDVDRRAGAILFETPARRSGMEAAPTDAEVATYAANLCMIFNALAAEPDDLTLQVEALARVSAETIVLRFGLRPASDKTTPWCRQGDDETPWQEALRILGQSALPYLQPTRSLRIYADDVVFIAKPAQYRWFTAAAGQTDADRLVADFMTGTAGPQRPLN